MVLTAEQRASLDAALLTKQTRPAGTIMTLLFMLMKRCIYDYLHMYMYVCTEKQAALEKQGSKGIKPSVISTTKGPAVYDRHR